MIVPSQKVRVVIATKPVDFRKGHDGLAAVAERELGLDPHSGLVIVFRAKRADRIKILLWDGTGLVMAYKRLEESSFAWPRIQDGVMRLSRAQFEALFEGLGHCRGLLRLFSVHRTENSACGRPATKGSGCGLSRPIVRSAWSDARPRIPV